MLLSPFTHAIETSEWKNRQDLTVGQPGLVKVTLPPATLDVAQEDLRDLRVMDPSGQEVPYLIQRSAPAGAPAPRPVATFRVMLGAATTEILVETGTTRAVEVLELTSPASGFLKAGRVELSAGDEPWETLAEGVPLFRQPGADQLQIPLGGRKISRVRITLDDTRSRPVPFTGATLQLSAERAIATEPLPVQIVRREEFVGDTVLTLDLGAAHLPLASLEFVTAEPLFTRAVTVGIADLQDGRPTERILAGGIIYRVAVDGLAPHAKLTLPVEATAPARQISVRVANRDSPPLPLEAVRASQRPQWLVFRAAVPGTFTVWSGHSQVSAPHYDLTGLAQALETFPLSGLSLPTPQPNPAYRRPEALRDTAVLGVALDPAPWHYRREVILASGGVQELELPLDLLADTQPGFGDLRLLREGKQIPYLLERTALSRPAKLALIAADDPRRPRTSRWELKLPKAGLPLTRLTLASTTTLFQRHFRLVESIADDRGNPFPRTLAEAEWNREPGQARPLAMTFYSSPQSDTLWLETDNGDNPPIALTSAETAYPVVRLLFKAEPGPLALYYGNQQAEAPRYDIRLAASQLLAAEKSLATLAPGETSHGEKSTAGIFSRRAGLLFWGALGFVVIGLLLAIAKLLPKPPGPKS